MNRLRHIDIVRRLIGAALLSLMLGQGMALVHAIEHANVPTAVADADDADHAWGHLAGSSACHLLDHLLVGQAPGDEYAGPPCVPTPALPLVAPPPPICCGPAPRPYEARGPPRA